MKQTKLETSYKSSIQEFQYKTKKGGLFRPPNVNFDSLLSTLFLSAAEL